MVAESFKFIVLRLLQIHFSVKQIESVQFYSCPQAKISPGFYHYSPGKRELSIPPKQHFLKIFLPEQKEGGGGEDCVVEKITKINKGIGRKF